MRIYLIGLPGSGKTTIGRELATILGLEFVDMDNLIEAKAGKTIEQIFSNKGETHFRKLEREVLKETTLLHNVVIATGGGAPCFFNNMEVITNNGIAVYLDVSVDNIVYRLTNSKSATERPLVKNKTPLEVKEYVCEILKKRAPYYLKSSVIITDDNIQASEVAEKINTFTTTS